MKRSQSLGFAAFALLAASLFMTQSASATPTCTTYSVPPQTAVGQWPLNGDNRTSNPEKSFMYNCTTADPNGDWAPVWEAAQQIGNAGGSTALAQLFTTNHVRVYYVDDLNQMNAVFGTTFTNPPAPAIQWGTTITVATPNVPLYASVVFRNPVNLGKGAVPNDVHGVIMHELGHDYDLIWHSPSTSSQRYLTALNADITAFNQVAQNVVFKTGITSNCAGNHTNYQILQCEFDGAVSGSGEGETADKEAWANFFGMYVGNSVNYWLEVTHGSDFVSDLSNTAYFQNVRAYMVGLRNGTSPF